MPLLPSRPCIIPMRGCFLARRQAQYAGQITLQPQTGPAVRAGRNHDPPDQGADVVTRLKPRLLVAQGLEQPAEGPGPCTKRRRRVPVTPSYSATSADPWPKFAFTAIQKRCSYRFFSLFLQNSFFKFFKKFRKN